MTGAGAAPAPLNPPGREPTQIVEAPAASELFFVRDFLAPRGRADFEPRADRPGDEGRPADDGAVAEGRARGGPETEGPRHLSRLRPPR